MLWTFVKTKQNKHHSHHHPIPYLKNLHANRNKLHKNEVWLNKVYTEWNKWQIINKTGEGLIQCWNKQKKMESFSKGV